MSNDKALFESNLTQFDLLARGKVRDIYALDDDKLLIITTDRLSAYDVIMPKAIPHKGEVLTRVSNFWFNKTAHIIDNHLLDISFSQVAADKAQCEQIGERAIITRRLKPLPVEAVVRGYLNGSGWRDYQDTGKVCGIALPAGLRQAEQLPEPIFTPATKAEVGDHDINITFAQMGEMIGESLAQQVKDVSLQIYQEASEYAKQCGIIIADTKFEFGLDDAGKLYLIDEALTPDSSRFWPVSQYQVGISPPSFDKQFVRDYLETLDWDKTAPGPDIPDDIIAKTAAKYEEAERLLCRHS